MAGCVVVLVLVVEARVDTGQKYVCWSCLVPDVEMDCYCVGQMDSLSLAVCFQKAWTEEGENPQKTLQKTLS